MKPKSNFFIIYHKMYGKRRKKTYIECDDYLVCRYKDLKLLPDKYDIVDGNSSIPFDNYIN